jgi:hypothetical protein
LVLEKEPDIISDAVMIVRDCSDFGLLGCDPLPCNCPVTQLNPHPAHFDLENGDSMFLRNIYIPLQNYTYHKSEYYNMEEG